ncbi:MAG: rhodanese-like domain-containing protein [Gemmata sp.]
MKYLVLAAVFAAGYLTAHLTAPGGAADQPGTPPTPARVEPPNPNIDFAAHIVAAQNAQKHRESRRLSEADFLKMSKEEGVIVLDARSKAMYDLLHIEGAINLSFPEIDIESLKKTLPDKDAKVLIYCNNNFTPAAGRPQPNQGPGPGAPVDPVTAKANLAMRPKSAPMSLNISTYTALHSYGYKNVYELAPLLDPAKTKLKLVSTRK